MTRRRTDFIFDMHVEDDANCSRYCRVHRYYDFEFQTHARFPVTRNFHSNTHGWLSRPVYVGPGAWLPKKPTQAQMTNMQANCPHTQGDLVCNGCLRHTFRLLFP